MEHIGQPSELPGQLTVNNGPNLLERYTTGPENDTPISQEYWEQFRAGDKAKPWDQDSYPASPLELRDLEIQIGADGKTIELVGIPDKANIDISSGHSSAVLHKDGGLPESMDRINVPENPLYPVLPSTSNPSFRLRGRYDATNDVLDPEADIFMVAGEADGGQDEERPHLASIFP
jgi:hypothetical protein